MPARHGFSLLELLVSLAILAAITTMALRATNNLQSQTRYQTTTHTLNEIRDAIVGPANLRGPDGSAQVTGFVADVGRLPQFQNSSTDPLYSDSDPLTIPDPLDELLEKPASIPVFNFYSGNFDNTVSVGVGWQGPYVRLGAGPSNIRDGWGKSFHVYANNSYTPLNTPGTTSISQIASWGADNVPDTNHVTVGGGDSTGYNADVSIPNALNLNGGFTATAILSGQVSMISGTDQAPSPNAGNISGTAPNDHFTRTSGAVGVPTNVPVEVWVCYFGPDTTQTPNPVAEVAVKLTGTSYLISGTNVTIGPRILRAYVLPSGVTTFNASAVASAYVVSPPMSVNVTGGGQTMPTIYLPHYSQ